MTAYDVLVEETDPRVVHFEMDLFWVTRGARDPVDLPPAPHRVRQYHVKDMNQAGSFADPGTGLIDFPRIFGSTRKVEEYIVERDDAGTPPRTPADALDTARRGLRLPGRRALLGRLSRRAARPTRRSGPLSASASRAAVARTASSREGCVGGWPAGTSTSTS